MWQPINLTEACPANSQLAACAPFAYTFLNMLVQLYGGAKDLEIQEKLHSNEEEKLDKVEMYDFIVVGAGSAGSIVANRLSAHKKLRVFLLDAGTEQPKVSDVPGFSSVLLGSSIDWKYLTEPNGKSCAARPGGRCAWPRGKVMGGCSTINSLAYVRGNKLDYDGWAAMGNKGWSYDEVLPYFKKTEKNLNINSVSRKYHGTRGEQPVSFNVYTDKPSKIITEGFHELGLPIRDFNAENQTATMQAQAIVKDGMRYSAYESFVAPIRYKRPNLTVRNNTEVIQILIANKTAYGVKYRRDGKEYTAYACKEVIVSGGVVNSPKLLLLSGIGPKSHLSSLNITVVQDLPVGKNLHDHATFNGYFIRLPKDIATNISHQELLDEIKSFKKEKKKSGPLATSGMDSTITFIKTDPSLPAPDISFQVGGIGPLQDYIDNPDLAYNFRVFPASHYDGIITRVSLMTPKSRGYLLLNSSDPLAHPLIFPGYFDNSEDIEPLIKGMNFFARLNETNAFKSNGIEFVETPTGECKNLQWGTDDYIRCLIKYYSATPHHQVGTCKMGPDGDETAVVDPRLKVHGICGLRVMDASVIPKIIRGNTNAASMLMGEKGVAMLIEDWLNKRINCKCTRRCSVGGPSTS